VKLLVDCTKKTDAGRAIGSGRRMSACRKLNTTVLAPIPSASDATAITKGTGLR
jgi:hypothetical protein